MAEAAPAAPRTEVADPGEIEARILSRLSPSPSDENDVIRDLALPAAAASAAILSLELQGRLLRVPGGRLALG